MGRQQYQEHEDDGNQQSSLHNYEDSIYHTDY